MSIVKIVLNINGVDTPVSIDEAKKLYNDLKVVFGNEQYWTLQPKDQKQDYYGQHSFPGVDLSKFRY